MKIACFFRAKGRFARLKEWIAFFHAFCKERYPFFTKSEKSNLLFCFGHKKGKSMVKRTTLKCIITLSLGVTLYDILSCRSFKKSNGSKSLVALYLKSDGSISLLSLFTYRVTGAIRSCCLLQKEWIERFALNALYEKSEGSKRANSQPWINKAKILNYIPDLFYCK